MFSDTTGSNLKKACSCSWTCTYDLLGVTDCVGGFTQDKYFISLLHGCGRLILKNHSLGYAKVQMEQISSFLGPPGTLL